HFTLGSLRYLMESAGFGLVSGTEYVRSIFSLKSAGVQNFNEYNSIRNYLVWNERYRWIFPMTVSGLKQLAKRWKTRLLG
ncbi:MAG: hypothetical protein RL041_893, partial [Bacteroidota bacterium]